MGASCKDCDEPEKTKSDAAPPPKPALEAAAPEAAAAPIADASTDAVAEEEEIYGEAGTSSCRLAYGPAEQPFRGSAMLRMNGAELQLIANEGGRPRIFPLAIPPIPPKSAAPPPKPPKPATFFGMRWPPCELAGKFVYCPGNEGVITRATIAGSAITDVKTVVGAKARKNTRIAAAMLGPEHSIVAWLESHTTSEGSMLQAFASLDDNKGDRISEDGAGATTLRFLQRKDDAIAVYLDTRTSMVPVHARPVKLKDNGIGLSSDVVVTVGGVPERGIDLTVAAVGDATFAFIPMPKDSADFGMNMIPIQEPLKEDSQTYWSLYPNGIDPAPMAATPSRDDKTAWVVRTRPREKAVGSPRILELGKVDAKADFATLGELAPAKNVSDIDILEDDAKSVWILYGDSSATWLERRVCD